MVMWHWHTGHTTHFGYCLHAVTISRSARQEFFCGSNVL